MKAMSRIMRVAVLLLVVAVGTSSTPAQTAEEAEKGICRTNLLLIYQAIQAYRQAQKTLPDRLSDLLPAFLADPEVLNCPTSKRKGETSYVTAEYSKSEINDPRTTYLYEFRTNRIPRVIGGGSRRSMREWKQRQMGLLGSEVPMVRCFLMHDRTLNLSFGGKVYESGVEWEQQFTHLVRPHDLFFSRLFADGTAAQIVRIPARPSQATDRLIDLSDFYNADLKRAWYGDDPGNSFTNLGVGLKTFGGVQFDVRGLIQLRGDAAWIEVYPEAVTNITVGLRGRRLHFLHATVNQVKPQVEIGIYVVHYENGRTGKIPIRYGVQVAHWRPTSADAIKGEDSEVTWVGTNESVKSRGKSIALYRTSWKNPLPDFVIQSFDFVSTATESGPFLVAVTVEP